MNKAIVELSDTWPWPSHPLCRASYYVHVLQSARPTDISSLSLWLYRILDPQVLHRQSDYLCVQYDYHIKDTLGLTHQTLYQISG